MVSDFNLLLAWSDLNRPYTQNVHNFMQFPVINVCLKSQTKLHLFLTVYVASILVVIGSVYGL